jgi:signal transduction histidine kinase
LLNIEKRAEKLGAKIAITSTIGAGTVVELLLPQTSEID